MTPVGTHEKKSLELTRNAFTGVALVTFDELLERLREIYKALSPDEAPLIRSGATPF